MIKILNQSLQRGLIQQLVTNNEIIIHAVGGKHQVLTLPSLQYIAPAGR